jgi:hypothetical protein
LRRFTLGIVPYGADAGGLNPDYAAVSAVVPFEIGTAEQPRAEPSYLVTWVSISSHENSWLLARHLGNFKDLLTFFQSRTVAAAPAHAP